MAAALKKFSRLLQHPLMPAVAVLIALAFSLTTLWNGFSLDDNFHRLVFKGEKSLIPASASPLNLFCFMSGEPEDATRLKNIGIYTWMFSEKIKIFFFRPLSSLSHCLDYLLWPDSPMLMHAQNLFWLALLVAVSAVLYRNLMGAGWAAGLAALLFSVDYAHGPTAGWIANRNSLLACLFGACCLVCYDRLKHASWKKGAILAFLFFILSLLSAEAGITTLAYLFAYALFLQGGTLRRRLAGLVPFLIIVVFWKAAYALMGFGAADVMGGFYVDPVHDPLIFLKAVLIRAPVNLLGQFAAPPVFVFMLAPAACVAAGIVFTVFFLMVLLPLLRRDRNVRFWAAGTILAVIPICAVSPGDRNLMFVSLGAAGLMARAFFCFRSMAEQPASRLWKVAAWFLFGEFFLIHGIITPMSSQNANKHVIAIARKIEQVSATLPSGAENKNRIFVLVNTPMHLIFVANVMHYRALQEQVNPMLSLVSGIGSLTITRIDGSTLKIIMDYGSSPMKSNFMMLDKSRQKHTGDRIDLAGMSVEVLAEDSGMPSEMLFRFKAPLEDERYLWFRWGDNSYEPFTLPAIGETVKLETASPWSQNKADNKRM